MPEVVVRSAVDSDLPAVTDLYNHYVAATTSTFDLEPVSVEARRDWFGHYSPVGRHRLLLAVDGDDLLGYATSSSFRDRAAYASSVETSVYLDPSAQGCGIGSRLYDRLLAELAEEDVHRAYAGIALPNDASVALHLRFGFHHVGTYSEVGRKLGRWVDVAWYEREMP
ncbi:MAG: GNAT family N-acetyltransferase [Micromonosporaceae bacterium]